MNNDLGKERIKHLVNAYLDDSNILLKREIYFLLKEMLRQNKDKDVEKLLRKIGIKLFFHQKELREALDAFERDKKVFLVNNEDTVHSSLFMTKEKDYSYHFSKKDTSILNSYVELFLKKSSESLYTFYQNLRDNGGIMVSRGRKNNKTFVIDRENIFLFVRPLETILDAFKLVGEIGYAYYYYLSSDEKVPCCDVLTNVKDEIPIRFLQLLFIKFIYDINKYSLGNNLKQYFDNEIKEYSSIQNDYEKFKKELASYVAYSYIKKDDVVERIYQEISENDVDELFQNAINSNKIKQYSLKK